MFDELIRRNDVEDCRRQAFVLRNRALEGSRAFLSRGDPEHGREDTSRVLLNSRLVVAGIDVALGQDLGQMLSALIRFDKEVVLELSCCCDRMEIRLECLRDALVTDPFSPAAWFRFEVEYLQCAAIGKLADCDSEVGYGQRVIREQRRRLYVASSTRLASARSLYGRTCRGELPYESLTTASCAAYATLEMADYAYPLQP